MSEGIILTTTHPRVQCIDLRATFERRFRYAWDESYAAERPDFRRVEAPWLTVIPCRFGRIFPWGGLRLAAYCAAGPLKRRDLERLPGVTVAQGGGRGCPEVVLSFDAEMIDRVAAVLRARRPRRFSDEQRARLLAASAGSRFVKGRTRDGARAPRMNRETTISEPVGVWWRVLGARSQDTPDAAAIAASTAFPPPAGGCPVQPGRPTGGRWRPFRCDRSTAPGCGRPILLGRPKGSGGRPIATVTRN
jgi:hypothetical protein